jgi:carbonic anhydrase/acetyltransferase-like protein (isoleucine patch superfamily)
VIHPSAVIDPTAIIRGDVTIGEDSSVGWYSIVRGNVKIGKRLRLGALSSIEGNVTIGDDCTIRGKCEIPNAILGNRVSIYAGTIFYDTPHPPDGPNEPPVIEDDVVICCNAAVLGGCTVGAGSLIGARVFVTEDIPPGSLVTVENRLKVRPRTR